MEKKKKTIFDLTKEEIKVLTKEYNKTYYGKNTNLLSAFGSLSLIICVLALCIIYRDIIPGVFDMALWVIVFILCLGEIIFYQVEHKIMFKRFLKIEKGIEV